VFHTELYRMGSSASTDFLQLFCKLTITVYLLGYGSIHTVYK
jgi:hypothetical protein